jgi:hypothetical protein
VLELEEDDMLGQYISRVEVLGFFDGYRKEDGNEV